MPGRPVGAGSAATCAQAVLGCAGIPDLVEFREVLLGGLLIVDVGDPVPAVGAQPIHDRAVVGDQIGGGTLRGVRCNVTDVDAARQATAHRDEAVAVTHDACGLG